jgi:hypothetical protein
MSMVKGFALVAALALCAGAAFAETPSLGKPVTEADLALWDISIGPDGKGLPSGSGTAAQGAQIFAQKCELCHGPGGTGGKNSVLINAPGKTERTMALYVPHATTVFDFIRRAMPFPQPKSLSSDEVYALTAFILAGNKLIPEDQVMDAKSLPQVKMPNRDNFIVKFPDKI